MTTFRAHPQDALSFLWKEFPKATMELEKSHDGSRLIGYTFHIGRSKHFQALEGSGGIDFERLRLFRDCAVYARDHAAYVRAKRFAKVAL